MTATGTRRLPLLPITRRLAAGPSRRASRALISMESSVTSATPSPARNSHLRLRFVCQSFVGQSRRGWPATSTLGAVRPGTPLQNRPPSKIPGQPQRSERGCPFRRTTRPRNRGCGPTRAVLGHPCHSRATGRIQFGGGPAWRKCRILCKLA